VTILEKEFDMYVEFESSSYFHIIKMLYCFLVLLVINSRTLR